LKVLACVVHCEVGIVKVFFILVAGLTAVLLVLLLVLLVVVLLVVMLLHLRLLLLLLIVLWSLVTPRRLTQPQPLLHDVLDGRL